MVVDDGSSDGSQAIIREILKERPETPFIALDENVGNTTAFNKGLALAKGKYVIDLACDDILYPYKISKQVEFFESQPADVGVIYSDVRRITEFDEVLGFHFAKQNRFFPYQGHVCAKLISTYFLPTVSMMIRKEVLDMMDGYDESLAYEDFDFWVRSSRDWKYAYQSDVLMDWVKHHDSFSKQAYKAHDRQLESTFRVCEKIRAMNPSIAEEEALIQRVKLEIRQSVITGNHKMARKFGRMLKELGAMEGLYYLLLLFNRLGIDLSSWTKVYHILRYGR